jgi:hypothetical protein
VLCQFPESAIVDTRSQVAWVGSNVEFRLGKPAPQSVIENRLEWLPDLSCDSGDAFGKIVVEGYRFPHTIMMTDCAAVCACLRWLARVSLPRL